MRSNRKLFKGEIDLIEYLAAEAGYPLHKGWNETIRAYPITKDRIRTIALLINGDKVNLQQESFDIASCKFIDEDNVEVVAYLLVDMNKILCELDLWKVDDSPIIKIPSKEYFNKVPLIE